MDILNWSVYENEYDLRRVMAQEVIQPGKEVYNGIIQSN